MSIPDPTAIAIELETHPQSSALAAYVGQVLFRAAREHEPDLTLVASGVVPEIALEQAQTDHGNALRILEHGPAGARDWALLSALLARAIATQPPASAEQWRQLGVDLVWLVAHTGLNVFDPLAQLLGERGGPLWETLADLALAPEALGLGRAEALVAALALGTTRGNLVDQAALRLLRDSTDALVRSAASRAALAPRSKLAGELRALPRGPFVTILLGMTGLLLVKGACSLFARHALGLRRPAELCLGAEGIEVSYRSELLGRVLRQNRVLLPLSGLARVAREVRFARLGLYSGLLALVLGTYFGVGFLIDALRVPGGSPSLLGIGLLSVAGGIGLDLALSRLSDAARGRCRMLVIPRRGKGLCIGGLDTTLTDRMLRELRGVLAQPDHPGEPEVLPAQRG